MNNSQVDIGSIIGDRFLVKTVIAAGALSRVYIVLDRVSQLEVALKLYTWPEFAKNDVWKRYQREFSTFAKLDHPNLAKYIYSGTHKGNPYVVMELEKGKSLKSLLLLHKIVPTRIAIYIMQGLLSALAYLHKNGIIHRDVKPANILVDADGKLKLIDLSIAKSWTDSDITDPGLPIGTPIYMAPEQRFGETQGPKSDVFSAGLVFYEMLTGKTPWSKFSQGWPKNTADWRRYKLPSEINPMVSRELDFIIAKAIAYSPGERYASAKEFLDELSKLKIQVSKTEWQYWISGRKIIKLESQSQKVKSDTKLAYYLVGLILLSIIILGLIAMVR